MVKIKIGNYERGRYYCEYCYSGRGRCIGKHTYDTGEKLKKVLTLVKSLTFGRIKLIEDEWSYDGSGYYNWYRIHYTLYVILFKKNKKEA